MESNQIIQNDFIQLRQSIKKLNSYEKEQSILLNCLERIIETVTDNEFEGLVWKARVGKSSGRIGARLQFQNLNLMNKDLSEVFKPTIDNLKMIFSNQPLALATSVEKQGQLVKKLECTVQLKIPEQKSHLDLP